MNTLLMKHKPADLEPEKWVELWNNQGYALQPLANTLKEMAAGLGRVRSDDFDSANHYGRLVHDLAQKEIIQKILDLLPSSVAK